MTPLDPVRVLALLQTQPQSSEQLAARLSLERAVVHKLLLGLQREGRVKRVGLAQQWALPTFTARAGRRRTFDADVFLAALRRVLAGTALATEDLILRTGYSRNVVKNACAHLLTVGDLAHFGIGRGARWCLPEYEHRESRSPDGDGQRRVGRLSAKDTSPLPPACLEKREAGSEPADSHPPTKKAARPFQQQAALDVLVAEQRTPKNTKVPADSGVSWWTAFADPTLPREAFATAAHRRDVEMCATNHAWRRQTVPSLQHGTPASAKGIL